MSYKLDLRTIKRVLEKKPNQQLYEIMTTYKASYDEVVLSLVAEIIQSRGLSVDDFDHNH